MNSSSNIYEFTNSNTTALILKIQAELMSNMTDSYTNSVQRLAYTKLTNYHTTGPRVSKNANRETCVYYLVTYPPNSWQIVFF